MPIYVFECNECNKEFETVTKIGTTNTECKYCGCEAQKTMNSFLTVSTGLPNGFAHGK